MRIATFNLESLDLPPKSSVPLDERAEILKPQLQRINADILCLQEVNAQRHVGEKYRCFKALDQLIAGTKYESFNRVTSTQPSGGAAEVHNLVILSRYPIVSHDQLHHTFLPSIDYTDVTSLDPTNHRRQITFDRPILMAKVDIGKHVFLNVFNVHLRAPLATAIPGQKLAPFVWKSVSGWAEGYFLSHIKRVGQAFELRMKIEELFDADPHANVVVCGDFNAGADEGPLRLAIATEEDTGNGYLATRALVLLERSLPEERRYTVIHHGSHQMLDHILVSRSTLAKFQVLEVHNETLSDELVSFGKVHAEPGSLHAPVVAEFGIDWH